MTTCPTCQRTVDPLRAPAVGVREGRVVSYCSKECALAAESHPVIVPTKPAKKRDATPIPIAMKRTPGTGVPTRRTPPGGVPTDSGPVIEIVHEPASGVVTSAADARSGKAVAPSNRAETDGAIQISETGHIDDYVDYEPRRGRGWLVFLLLLLMLGGGAFAAYELGYLDELLHHKSSAAVVPPATPATEPTPIDAAPPSITGDAAVERARVVLRAELKSASPRVQRVAASALARTGDAEAIAQLAAGLGQETSDIAKLDVAYTLARAGDKRGADALVAGLAATRRDVRAEAGRRLALLGDKRAIPTLAEYLEVSQLRLGAAEQLALLAEPRAVKALDQVRADPKSSPDDQARAAIALGLALAATPAASRTGGSDVVPALHALLADTRFNPMAAAALAALHDEAARPLLVKQLAIPSLRVGAARALRQLDPKLDPAQLLPALLAALAAQDSEPVEDPARRDIIRIQAAEAILVLAGPDAWSEHD